MKKGIIFLIIMFLTVPIPLLASEDTSGIVSYGTQSNISGTAGVKEVTLSTELSGVMLSNQHSLFFEGNDSFKIETGQPVKDFIILDDLDKDGIKDVAVVLDVSDSYDNLAIISAKESKVLFSTKYTFDSVNYDGIKSVKNSVIRQMLYQDGLLYCLYNYTIVAIDTITYKTNFSYTAKDNIWKIALVDQSLLFTTQLGQVGSLDSKSGSELYCQQITTPMKVASRYSLDQMDDVTLNTWDIMAVNDKVYLSSEDGNLYEISKETGEIKNTLSLEAIEQEQLTKQMAMYTSFDYSLHRERIYSTGVYSKLFMSYKMKMIDQQYMLVECFMGDSGYSKITEMHSDEVKIPVSTIIVDTKDFSIKTRISIEQYSLIASSGVITTYQDKQVYVVPTVMKDGKAKLFIYNIEDGALLQQNTIGIGTYNQDTPMAFMTKINNRYFIEVIGGSVIEIASDLKTTKYFDNSMSVKAITNTKDKTLTSVSSGGKVIKIQMLSTKVANDIEASIDAPTNYPNNGFEAIQYNESTNQVLALVNEVNNEGIVASHIIIINLQDNSMIDKKVLINKGRDEKGKYYENYVQGQSIAYLPDLNGDKKAELLVDNYVIDGSSYTIKSMHEQAVEETGTVVPVGDINSDGIEDLVCVMENQMRVYTSKISGYDITYTKTNILTKYDKALLNQTHVKSVGDLDNDGSKEFVINARNEQGCQYYQVINPKDLSIRFSLMKDGVFNWGESFSLLNLDYNQDGINDIQCQLNSKHAILSGKDGSTILEYSMDIGNYYSREESPTPLDEIFPINITDTTEPLLILEDINEDGIKEFGHLVYGERGQEFVVLNGKTYEPLKQIMINEYNRSSIQSIVSVVGQPRIVINNETSNQIFDYQKESLVVGCNIPVTKARALSNGDIQLESSDQQLYSINDQTDFKVLHLDKEKVSSGNIKVGFECDKSGVMSIYDNGFLVGTTTKNEYDIKLVNGKHKVLFSYDDGHGKVTHQEKEIVVEKGNTLRYIFMLLSLVVILLGVGAIFYPRYRLLKKAGVKHG